MKTEKNEKGKIRLVLDQLSLEEYIILDELFRCGQLKEIAGITVENVQLNSITLSPEPSVKLSEWIIASEQYPIENKTNLKTAPNVYYSPVDLGVAPAGGAVRSSSNNTTKSRIIDLDVQAIEFTVILTPENEKIAVKFLVRPLDDDPYLPEGLQLTVFNEKEVMDLEIAKGVESEIILPPKEYDYIGKEGDQFVVRISLGNISLNEKFEI